MRWILIIFTSVAMNGGLKLANAAKDEFLRPRGVPPEFALLRSSGGKFILSRVVTKPVFETQQTIGTNGRPVPKSRRTARLVSENQTEEVPINEFDVFTLAGKKYPKSSMPMLVKWLADRKKPWRALVSKDGKPIDPYYRQFASEGTLVLVRKTKARSHPVPATLPKSAENPGTKPKQGTKTSKLPGRSRKNGKRVDIRFRNRAKQPVRVFWVDYEGREKDFGTIPAGAAIVQCSSSRCVWRFKIFGETVTTCLTDESPIQSFEIQPPKYVLTKFEGEVLKLINVIRKNNGLQTLRHNRKLSAASRDHSKYMSRTDDFSHYSADPGKYYFTDRAGLFGTSAISENIAWDGGGPKSVVNMWMNSPGHQANILDPSATTMGIGHAGVYWTQMFGSQPPKK